MSSDQKSYQSSFEADLPSKGASTPDAAASPTPPTEGSGAPTFDKYNVFRFVDIPYKVRNPYIVAAIACMGGLLFGFASSDMTTFIGNRNYNEYFNTPDAVDQAGISAAFPGGAFLGSLYSSGVSDKFGRKAMIQQLCFIWMVGCAIQCACNNRASLSWGRIIMGFAIGISSSNVPLFLSELSPQNIRARLTGAFQMLVNGGILINYFISYGSSKIHGPSSFRLAWGLQMVPGFILLVGTFILTESPRWLAKVGRWDECRSVLMYLREGTWDKDTESQVVQSEMLEIQEVVGAENKQKVTFFDLFRGGVNLRRTVAAVSAQMWQQLTGTNVVLYYATPIVEMTGHPNDTFRFTVILYCILVGMIIPCLLFIDRWSRRWLMTLGALWMCTCMCLLAGLTGVAGVPTGPQGLNGDPTIRITIPDNKRPYGKAALAFTYLYFSGYAMSWAPTPWVYLAEVFPSNQRGLGNGLGSAINWLFNFAVTMATPPGFVNITWKMYVIFAVFCFVAVIHVFATFPETQGYTLEEVNAVFENGELAFKTDPVYLTFQRWRGKNVHKPWTMGPERHTEKTSPREAIEHAELVE